MTDPSPPKPPKPALLLVDDEPEILYSLQGLLRREFDLHTAQSGQEALAILEKHPIHVVMTDQRMPEMTGVELMGRVRSEYPEAIRIVFTGYADIKAVIEAINNGGLFRYITKPWDPDDLLATLREAVAAHDRACEQRRLLQDVRRFLAHAGKASPPPVEESGQRPAATPTSHTAEALLARIDRILET